MSPTAWFDRWATQYDGERRLLISPFDAFYGAAAEVAALGRTGEGARVLDLGAGTGLLTAALADALPGAHFTLLDEAPGMLAQARERLEPLGREAVHVVQGDLVADLPDGPYDVIASALAIHHLAHEDQARLYGLARERLAPGGVFLNAEQVAGPSPELEDHFVERELVHARAGGFSAQAEEQAWIRWSADRHVPVERQLEWLHEAGFPTVECVYKAWRFAVVAGWR